MVKRLQVAKYYLATSTQGKKKEWYRLIINGKNLIL